MKHANIYFWWRLPENSVQFLCTPESKMYQNLISKSLGFAAAY